MLMLYLVCVRVNCQLDTQNKHLPAVDKQKMKLNKLLNPELL